MEAASTWWVPLRCLLGSVWFTIFRPSSAQTAVIYLWKWAYWNLHFFQEMHSLRYCLISGVFLSSCPTNLDCFTFEQRPPFSVVRMPQSARVPRLREAITRVDRNSCCPEMKVFPPMASLNHFVSWLTQLVPWLDQSVPLIRQSVHWLSQTVNWLREEFLTQWLTSAWSVSGGQGPHSSCLSTVLITLQLYSLRCSSM